MHANKEGTVIQNEYSYVLGGMESHDMYMYAKHSLFSCFGSTDMLFQLRNLLI